MVVLLLIAAFVAGAVLRPQLEVQYNKLKDKVLEKLGKK